MSKTIIAIFLIVALAFSVSATYITINNFGKTEITQSPNSGNLGVYVKPARTANVGLIVLPEQKESEP